MTMLVSECHETNSCLWRNFADELLIFFKITYQVFRSVHHLTKQHTKLFRIWDRVKLGSLSNVKSKPQIMIWSHRSLWFDRTSTSHFNRIFSSVLLLQPAILHYQHVFLSSGTVDSLSHILADGSFEQCTAWNPWDLLLVDGNCFNK